MRKSNLIKKALVFATRAHASINHLRKYTDDPYIIHPIAVATTVEEHGGTDEMIAAALLHDVVEDTPITIEEIEYRFGLTVAGLVGWLTDVSEITDGNRAWRKAIDRAHTAKAPAEAHTIKLADLIDNSKSILEHDPKFAKLYIAEKTELLDVLDKGDKRLHRIARKIILDYHRNK